jgi:predicted nucleic acid-binding protein
MATLIDSSVLIAAERGQLSFDDIAARYSDEDVAISAVTASELLHGVYRARILGRGLTIDEVHAVTAIARRIAAMALLEPQLDINYEAVSASISPWPSSDEITNHLSVERRIADAK